jgi:hypothetical protein
MKNEVTAEEDNRASHNVSFAKLNSQAFAAQIIKVHPAKCHHKDNVPKFCSSEQKGSGELHAANNLSPKMVLLAPNG